ncbi:MAG: exo-alpha-sialidase [Azoarcus sp.]|nr:exo-alpha-sialidase [Azoarcus sp.]
MTPAVRRVCGATAIAALTLWAAWPGLFPSPAPGFAVPVSHPAGIDEARIFSALPSETPPPQVHAASLAELPDGELAAVWFGGTREGSSDVRIFGMRGEPQADGGTHWELPEAIVTPEKTGAGLRRWVRKLGNPVILTTPRGERWLVYVSATLGGWATSRLNLLRQGVHAPERLVTSPFFNMSTLVKGAPIFFDNGDIGVPMYHELAGKFGELLVLAPNGKVRRKVRLAHGRRTLQPVVLVEDAAHAVALMRDARHEPPRVWRSETADAGRHWRAPETTDLPNPNSALGALRLDDGRMLAIANDTEGERLRLSLLVSEDRGQHWRLIHRFEDRQENLAAPLSAAVFRARLAADLATAGPRRAPLEATANDVMQNACRHDQCNWRYDYPYFVRAADGDFHLVYTWNGTFIRYIRFNAAWLQARLGAAR